MMNWKETPPLQLQGVKCYSFFNKENNSGAEIHHCLCTACRVENVMNLRSIQQRQSMLWDNKCEGRLSMMSDETVWCVHALLRDNYCSLTITNMRWEMAAHFSHKAGRATMVHALQQLEMPKISMCWGSSTTHGRTSKKLHGSGTQLPYSVQGGWELVMCFVVQLNDLLH